MTMTSTLSGFFLGRKKRPRKLERKEGDTIMTKENDKEVRGQCWEIETKNNILCFVNSWMSCHLDSYIDLILYSGNLIFQNETY